MSIPRLPVSEQVDKQLLKDFQAKPRDPKGRGEDTDVFTLPPTQEAQGLPSLPVQQTDGTSAFDSSQHGLKRTSEELGREAVEDRRASKLVSAYGPKTGAAFLRFFLVDTKCYAIDCLGTYLTHVQTCNVTRVQSATQSTASVHT